MQPIGYLERGCEASRIDAIQVPYYGSHQSLFPHPRCLWQRDTAHQQHADLGSSEETHGYTSKLCYVATLSLKGQ